MSRAKDRARAESGIIFRDGKLVRKEEWYAAHPTREMIAAQQAQVDAEIDRYRVEESIARQTAIRRESAPHRYYCTACRKYHTQSSKVGKEHTNFYLEEA
jgi:hypothetical protein